MIQTEEDFQFEAGEEGFAKILEKFKLWFIGPCKHYMTNILEHMDYIHKYQDQKSLIDILNNKTLSSIHVKDITYVFDNASMILDQGTSTLQTVIRKGNILDAFSYSEKLLFDIPEMTAITSLYKKLSISLEFDPNVFLYLKMNRKPYELKYLKPPTSSFANIGIKSISDLDKLVSKIKSIHDTHTSLIRTFQQLNSVLFLPLLPPGWTGNKNEVLYPIKVNTLRIHGIYNACADSLWISRDPYKMVSRIVTTLRHHI